MRFFYSGRHFAFAWFDRKGEIEQAGNLYNRIQNLPLEGLSVQVPYVKSLDSLMNDPGTKGHKAMLEKELLLTASYFYFAQKVWGGLDAKAIRKMDWFLPRKKVSYAAWLDHFLKTPGGFAEAGEPVYRQYGLLRGMLKRYSGIAREHTWAPLKGDKKAYRPGDSARIIGDIRQRLRVLGDLAPAPAPAPAPAGPAAAANGLPTASAIFDATLENAVKHFQNRFGIKPDGIIGPEMIRELNVPIQKRIQQIGVNMERCRWLPDTVRGYYLVVNIPEFRLHAYKGDSLLWDMNVVVGTSVYKTVIFSGNLKYVVFSPYWNVPPGIFRNETLPGIRKDKNYLALHHMEWYGNTVRQKPGPWNSLGGVKFLFPNSYNIYLHDTPAKSLFGENKRAFSHGCIRVADPGKLSLFVLQGDPGWDAQKVSEAMHRGREQYVTLKGNMPVFITYFTAWVDRQGNIQFRHDVYDRDTRLLAAIASPS
jgi:murein L,D-transpeptidase YcbB/YkuD